LGIYHYTLKKASTAFLAFVVDELKFFVSEVLIPKLECLYYDRLNQYHNDEFIHKKPSTLEAIISENKLQKPDSTVLCSINLHFISNINTSKNGIKIETPK